MSTPRDTVGHLFVLHGLIETFDYDAVVIPTDHRFDVKPHWLRSVTGDIAAAKPIRWPQHCARSNTGDPVWFISVADTHVLTDRELLRRVDEVLTEIAEADIEKAAGRVLPRVALPVLGIGAGGLGGQRGAVLKGLLETLHRAATTKGIDILLVASNRAAFGAAQHSRRHSHTAGHSRAWNLSVPEMSEARRLGTLAADGHLALFLGAGVSMAAGLPSWGDLLGEVGAELGQHPEDYDRLDDLDKAQYLATRLGPHQLNAKVTQAVGRRHKVALAHALLAGTACREAVTTNYDDLYERAVQATGRDRPTVLPWETVDRRRPWLLKLHGDIARPDSIVLTRRDFVLFDAKSRPAGSLLQALLLTKHLLIVGASLADDNVIRLAMEVDDYLERSDTRSIQGTFIDVSGVEARKTLWNRQFNWFVCDGQEPEDRVRRMEILLDAVAAHAATDASWILDPRFDGLLDEGDRGVVDDARKVLVQAKTGSDLLQPLQEALGISEDSCRQRAPEMTAYRYTRSTIEAGHPAWLARLAPRTLRSRPLYAGGFGRANTVAVPIILHPNGSRPAIVAVPVDNGRTAGQENAIGKAKDYLAISGFSRFGLIGAYERRSLAIASHLPFEQWGPFPARTHHRRQHPRPVATPRHHRHHRR